MNFGSILFYTTKVFKIFFNFQLSIPIDELENKTQMKCVYMSEDMKEQVWLHALSHVGAQLIERHGLETRQNLCSLY